MALDFSQHYWHQRWEIEPGVFTPGHNSVVELLNAAQLPDDLTGKRVLDIGAWNGCFSFECERRGASEVLGIGPEPAENTGLDMLRKHLGSKVRYQLGSIYDLDPAVLGQFDIVLCFGVFYHLRHPLLGLDNVRRICSGELFFETSIIDDELIVGRASHTLDEYDPRLRDLAILQFYRKDEFNKDPSNWFSPTLHAAKEMVASAGFEVLHASSWGVRGVLHARKVSGPPEYIRIGSGEGVYYDLFSRKLLGDIPGENESVQPVGESAPAPEPAQEPNPVSAKPRQGTVSEADVQTAFRLLLDREAEPAAVRYFTSLDSLADVRRQIMAAPEFVRCFIGADTNFNPYLNFHHIHTVRMTARRQEHLATLPLDFANKSVIEIGAGIGLHSTFFLDRGCTVLSTDGRAANVETMQALFDLYGWYAKRSKLSVGQVDIEAKTFPAPGRYDIVYCYGLLYHCADPALVIRNLRACSSGMLLLETSVQARDSGTLAVGNEDPHNVSQSVHGGGSHPTREWIVAELKKVFPFVGLPKTQPNHEYFPIDWSNPEQFENQTMRCVFVASDSPLPADAFTDVPAPQQSRMN